MTTYPYVNFKSVGVSIDKTTHVFMAERDCIIDSIRITNRANKASTIRAYVIKYNETSDKRETTCVSSNMEIKEGDSKEFLEGSLLYLNVGDVISIGLKYLHKAGIFISYRELMNYDQSPIIEDKSFFRVYKVYQGSEENEDDELRTQSVGRGGKIQKGVEFDNK